jgi:hypothetical protein
MSGQAKYKEPPLDKASTKFIIEAVGGNENREVQTGDYIVQKANIFCGALYRLSSLFDTLENMGLELAKERNALVSPTIGFCTELPERGMRGELIQIITKQELPKKEVVRDTDDGNIQRQQPTQVIVDNRRK